MDMIRECIWRNPEEFTIGVQYATITFLVMLVVWLKRATKKLHNEIDDIQSVPSLGEEFIGYSVKRRLDDGNMHIGTIVSYEGPEDNEHGYDWWVEYRNGYCETMDLEEILENVYI